MRAIPFRQRLQLTLAAARVSQAEIARVAGLDAKHLNDLCQGRRKNVSAQTVYALATALGCTSDWLLVIDGCLVSGRRPLAWTNALCVVLGLTVVHAFYWTDLRMRAPVVPALAGIAAAPLAHERSLP